MFAHNKTHIEFKQISVDKEGQVIDNFFVIKDKHGAYEDAKDFGLELD